MTIKLLVLKSGEELISMLPRCQCGESDDDQRVVGYFLNRPCVVKMKNPGVLNQDKKTTRSGFEVSLFHGCHYQQMNGFLSLLTGWLRW